MAKGISQKTKQKRGADRDSAKGPKRTADEALRDRADVARMRLDGLTQSQIAEEITRLRSYSVSQQTIALDLKAVRDEWLNISIDNYDKTRQIEITRLDQEEKFAIEKVAVLDACKVKDFQEAAAAVNKIDQSCNNCHEEWK